MLKVKYIAVHISNYSDIKETMKSCPSLYFLHEFTIFRDSLFTSFQYSWTWKVQLGASHPCQSPQSSFSSFWSSASHRSAYLCRASLQFHCKFPLKTTKKKQFISTIIKIQCKLQKLKAPLHTTVYLRMMMQHCKVVTVRSSHHSTWNILTL